MPEVPIFSCFEETIRWDNFYSIFYFYLNYKCCLLVGWDFFISIMHGSSHISMKWFRDIKKINEFGNMCKIIIIEIFWFLFTVYKILFCR